MLKKGGRILHILPSTNEVDHGFYMFSPTLFFDYYGENGFQINHMSLLKRNKMRTIDHNNSQRNLTWNTNYYPGMFDSGAILAASNEVIHVRVIVTKLEDSTFDKIPTQRNYKHIWSINWF